MFERMRALQQRIRQLRAEIAAVKEYSAMLDDCLSEGYVSCVTDEQAREEWWRTLCQIRELEEIA